MPDEQLYARHQGLGISQEQTVLVVGCGGIGSWLGYLLGLAGVQRLHLFDGDRIEEHNLSRLPFTPKDIGRYKSEALADLISRSRPGVEVTAHSHFDPEWHEAEVKECNWVVVSTDSHKSRVMIHNAVREKVEKFHWRIQYLEC